MILNLISLVWSVHFPVCKTWQGSTRSRRGSLPGAGAETGAAFRKLGQLWESWGSSWAFGAAPSGPGAERRLTDPPRTRKSKKEQQLTCEVCRKKCPAPHLSQEHKKCHYHNNFTSRLLPNWEREKLICLTSEII